MILRSMRYKFTDMLSYSSLKYKNMQEFDDSIDGWDGSMFTAGHPIFFTLYENKAILFPTPDQTVTSGIKLLYNQVPTDVVSLSDSPALPIIYHNTIMKYCMWQASLLDDDQQPAMMYKTDFAEDMRMLEKNETQDPVDRYHTITVLDYDN